jgi:hypothetical protein
MSDPSHDLQQVWVVVSEHDNVFHDRGEVVSVHWRQANAVAEAGSLCEAVGGELAKAWLNSDPDPECRVPPAGSWKVVCRCVD